MPVETITAGESAELVGPTDVFDRLIEVIDGDEAFLLDSERGAPSTGDRLTPGKSFQLSPREGRKEILHAVGADVTFQSIVQDNITGGKEQRQIRLAQSGTNVPRQLARALNQTPGANADILASDVSPPETGTLVVHVVLNAAAVFNAQIDIGGTVIENDANTGASLTAGAGHTLHLPARGDATYNFQVESAVQVNLIQVDYTREVVS